MDEQFIRYEKKSIFFAILTVLVFLYYEYPHPYFAYVLFWGVILITLQLCNYIFARNALKDIENKKKRDSFFLLNYFASSWWAGYLFIAGAGESSETEYIFRMFAIYMIYVFFLMALQYSRLLLVNYSVFMFVCLTTYLYMFTLLSEEVKSLMLLLIVFGCAAFLILGWLNHLQVCRNYEVYKENKRLIAKMDEMIVHDDLTNVHNRRYFTSELKKHFNLNARYQAQFSIAMLDIDNFKIINDKYGHQGGDQILIELCQLVLESIRVTDIFARYGGEEFVLILPENTINETVDVLNKLREKIAQHSFKIDEVLVPVTVSIGASAIAANDNETTLIRKADQALYKAKELGRNRVEQIM